MATQHTITPTPEPPHQLTRDARGEVYYHHAGGRVVPVRRYVVCDSYGPFEHHEGRGLEPERVLALLARGCPWERPDEELALPPRPAEDRTATVRTCACVLSALTILRDGNAIAVATVGNEGLVLPVTADVPRPGPTTCG